jgi:hypothetical protein
MAMGLQQVIDQVAKTRNLDKNNLGKDAFKGVVVNMSLGAETMPKETLRLIKIITDGGGIVCVSGGNNFANFYPRKGENYNNLAQVFASDTRVDSSGAAASTRDTTGNYRNTIRDRVSGATAQEPFQINLASVQNVQVSGSIVTPGTNGAVAILDATPAALVGKRARVVTVDELDAFFKWQNESLIVPALKGLNLDPKAGLSALPKAEQDKIKSASAAQFRSGFTDGAVMSNADFSQFATRQNNNYQAQRFAAAVPSGQTANNTYFDLNNVVFTPFETPDPIIYAIKSGKLVRAEGTRSDVKMGTSYASPSFLCKLLWRSGIVQKKETPAG